MGKEMERLKMQNEEKDREIETIRNQLFKNTSEMKRLRDINDELYEEAKMQRMQGKIKKRKSIDSDDNDQLVKKETKKIVRFKKFVRNKEQSAAYDSVASSQKGPVKSEQSFRKEFVEDTPFLS